MKASLDGMMADPGIPVVGDLLRLAFHASRFHPDARMRAGIGEAIDRMLDGASAPPLAARAAAAALAAAKGTALAPMVASAEDAELAARFWRLVTLETWRPGQETRPGNRPEAFIGSADAVGAGHGALLANVGAAKFHLRADRPDGVHGLHLGMARKPTDLGRQTWIDRAELEVARDGGLAITCEIAFSPGKLPNGRLAIRLANGRLVGSAPLRLDAGFLATRRPDGTIDRLALGDAGLRATAAAGYPLRVTPDGPEAAIRLASACTDRPLLYLASTVTKLAEPHKPLKLRHADSFDLIVRLAPLVDAPCALRCVRASHTGMLAEWMSLPAVAIALDLAPDQRAAIAAHYATT